MNWVISSTVLIIVIVGLRFLLKGKISLRLQYALWIIVLARLLIPFSIGETSLSINAWIDEIAKRKAVNEIYEFTQAELQSMTYEQAYEEVADKYANQGIDIEMIPEDEFAETIDNEILNTMTADSLSVAEIAKGIWLVGTFGVAGWFLLTNIRFWKKLIASRQLLELENVSTVSFTNEMLGDCKEKLSIYVCDEVETPCLFGLFSPAIYITSEAVKDEAVLRHVIAHEMTHYLHRDYLWGYCRALCLAIHWYNPFVWWAAVLSRNDAELACDEATIKRLGESERASYGRTLIGLTCERRPAVLLTATTMTGSGKDIKERISLIAKKPKMKMYAWITAVIVSILCVGCTFTGAKNDGAGDGTEAESSAENSENDSVNGEMDSESYEEGLENLREEIEEQQEKFENTLFYDSLTQDMLITDEEVNNRVLQLLMDEKELIDTIESKCEMDFEESIEVEGIPLYRVVEADNWDYYEDIARNYYSEEYLKKEFTARYTKETKLFVEANGKLYRAAADGVAVAFLEDSVNVWQVDNDTYYATITASSASGEYFLEGYRIQLSENNIYGFEIVDKLYVETNTKDFTYYADLTHDGVDESIRVSITDGSVQEDTKVKIRVYNEATLTVLYETELLLHPNLGESYYLVSCYGNYYLMDYKPSINHDTASCTYEVFYLNNEGEKVTFDSDEISISLSDVEELDKDAWKAFANQENMYFKGGFLLAGTNDGLLEYSTNASKKTYFENFSWLIAEDTESIERNLELFLEDVREMYSE